MSVNQPIQFKIIFIFAKGIYQDFRNLEPSHIEAELQLKKFINFQFPQLNLKIRKRKNH
jgi:hypothetical protein